MNKGMMTTLVTALFATALFLSGCAGLGAQKELSAEVVERSGGDTVMLFHGGSKEAKEVFCLNETLPVFRAAWESYGTMTYREVAKVKITRLRGDHYFEAEVVDGQVKDGDVVRKEGLGCLVQVPGGGSR